LILENQINAKEPFALLMSSTTSETQLTLEEKMKYEVGGNEMGPIKACFLNGFIVI